MSPRKKMRQARGKQKTRLEEIQLVLESTPSDKVVCRNIEAVKQELAAIDEALDDKGTFLGIVDKSELKKRKELLEDKFRFVEEERDLLRALRVALAEEELAVATAAAAKDMGKPPPLKRHKSEDDDDDDDDVNISNLHDCDIDDDDDREHDDVDESAAFASTSSVRKSAAAVAATPSSQSAITTKKKSNPFRFLAPPATECGIGDFLKKNAAMGTAAAPRRSAKRRISDRDAAEDDDDDKEAEFAL